MALSRSSTHTPQPVAGVVPPVPALSRAASVPVPVPKPASHWRHGPRSLAGLPCSQVSWVTAEEQLARGALSLPCPWELGGDASVAARVVSARLCDAALARIQLLCYKAKFAAPLLGFARPVGPELASGSPADERRASFAPASRSSKLPAIGDVGAPSATMLLYAWPERGTLAANIASMSWSARLSVAHGIAVALWNLHCLGESFSDLCGAAVGEQGLSPRTIGISKEGRPSLLWLGAHSAAAFPKGSGSGIVADVSHFGQLLLFLLTQPTLGSESDEHVDAVALLDQLQLKLDSCAQSRQIPTGSAEELRWPAKEATALLHLARRCLLSGPASGSVGPDELEMRPIVTSLASLLTAGLSRAPSALVPRPPPILEVDARADGMIATTKPDTQSRWLLLRGVLRARRAFKVGMEVPCCVCLEPALSRLGLLCGQAHSYRLLCCDCLDPYACSLIGTAELRRYNGGVVCPACKMDVGIMKGGNHTIFSKEQVLRKLQGVSLRRFREAVDTSSPPPDPQRTEDDAEASELAVLYHDKREDTVVVIELFRYIESDDPVRPRRIGEIVEYSWVQLQGEEKFQQFDPRCGYLKQHMSTRLFALEVAELMNLVCPECNCPLDPDPDGCAAMTCCNCSIAFCWLCLMKCDEGDAHPHVMEAHGSYFPRLQTVSLWHRRWRWLRVQPALTSLLPASQPEALAACRPMLADVNLWPFPEQEPPKPPCDSWESPDMEEWPLHEAARIGDLQRLEGELQRQDVNVNDIDHRHMTPLCYAAHEGRIHVIRMLMEANANPNVADDHGLTPLHYACREPPFLILDDVVSVLLSYPHVNANARDFTLTTPLMAAAEVGRAEVIPALLACPRVLPNEQNQMGYTPLMIASSAGHEAAVEMLLRCDKVEVSTRTMTNETVLHLAAKARSAQLVDMLLRHPQVDANAVADHGRTALMEAAATGAADVVQRILDTSGILVDVQDDQGWTPLMHATRAGSSACFEALLAKTHDVNVRSSAGETTLMMLARTCHSETAPSYRCLLMLLERGQAHLDLDLNATCAFGRSALMHAASYGCLPFVERLLLLGPSVDVTLEDESGETASSLASLCRNSTTFRKLRTLLPLPASHASTWVLSDGLLAKVVERTDRQLLKAGPRTVDTVDHTSSLTVEYDTMTLLSWRSAGWKLYDSTTFFQKHERRFLKKIVQRANGCSVDGKRCDDLSPHDFLKLVGVNRVYRLTVWQDSGWSLQEDDGIIKLCQWGVAEIGAPEDTRQEWHNDVKRPAKQEQVVLEEEADEVAEHGGDYLNGFFATFT